MILTGAMMTHTSNVHEVTGAADDAQPHNFFDNLPPLTAQALPYTFAKRHGVLIGQIETDTINILHRNSPEPVVLAEINRITRRNISLSHITDEQFSALLAQTYEQGSDQAMAMMEGVGEEMDLDQLA